MLVKQCATLQITINIGDINHENMGVVPLLLCSCGTENDALLILKTLRKVGVDLRSPGHHRYRWYKLTIPSHGWLIFHGFTHCFTHS